MNSKHRSPRSPRLTPLTAAVRGALAGTVLIGSAAAQELPVAQQAFATLGRADQAVTGNTLTVTQHTDRAILNWQSFNVGRDHEVRFKQPGASSIALNRIFQNDPSRILGKVSANGQIYLVNQNGFVFGQNATIDANTLVASTLDISDDTFERGITKVIDQDGRAALQGDGRVYRTDENGEKRKIAIEFEKGAKVNVQKQGRIIAAAPSVVNRGELTAPDGQIILVAASDKVYLQEAGADSGLRGLVVEVGSGGEVGNLGQLLAERGNVTLLGFAVNQQGRVSATTSVRANGSVRLLAREGGVARREGDAWKLEPTRTARAQDQGDGLGLRSRVTLGQGSLTEATPDLGDPARAVDGQTQEASRLDLMAHQVRLEKGATLRSLAGRAAIVATENPQSPATGNTANASRIHIDQGAVIDVSGVDRVSLPMERNVVEVELRSNELRDSPLQRNGVLYAQEVKVDIRKGTPLADIAGALERIERTVAERSTQGGSLDLVSEGDVVVARGALLDFSGGSLVYRPGYLNTTQLIADRRLVDIGDADPNVIYRGLLGKVSKHYRTWNYTQTWELPGLKNLGRYEQGYVEGKPAGHLGIKAAALALDGEMRALAVNGLRQRDPARQAPGGRLDIDLARTPDSTQAVVFGSAPAGKSIGPDDAFPKDEAAPDRPAPLVFDGERLRRSGITDAKITTNGTIRIASGQRVALPDGGRLDLTGGQIRVEGTIAARSGAVGLATRLTAATLGIMSGGIELTPTARLDLGGGWVNDRPAGAKSLADHSPLWIDGGRVEAVAEGDITVAAGGRIDVSGGGHRRTDRRVEAGDAGSIRLEAAGIDGSDLAVDGEMRGFALEGGHGGALTLVSDRIVLGGGAPDTPGEGGGTRTLVLAPDFFRRGGFARYAVGSNKSGVSVGDGARIDVRVQSRILDPDFVDQPTGRDLDTFSRIGLLPEVLRPAGDITLSLGQKVGQGGAAAAVGIGQGTAVTTDAGGRITLVSDASIVINGTLDAPAGTITATVTPPVGTDLAFLPQQGIWLGGNGRLHARGRALVTADHLGRPTGEVLAGGQITLHADRGFIVAEPGSVIDVSGTQAELALPVAAQVSATSYALRVVPSPAGAIALRAAEGIRLDGSLAGRPGQGPGAAGGELSLEIDPRTRIEPDIITPGQLPFPKVPGLIQVGAPTVDPAQAALVQGQPVPGTLYGIAALAPATVADGGFDTLSLRTQNRIEFLGPVELSAGRSLNLDAPVLAFQNSGETPGGRVTLAAAHVALGSTQTRPGAAQPALGEAELKVQAGTLDLVGAAALQGFAKTDLESRGDLRLIGVRTSQQQRDFTGEFLTAGDLTLTADQVYPTTLSQFRIAVEGRPDGLLSLLPGDATGEVLSAGGRLTLEAPRITQGGTLRAPLGELALKATDTLQLLAGSVTSNSAGNTVIPFGRTQGGLDWVYPLGGQNLVFAAPPAKTLSLQGASVELAAGAVVDTSGGGDLYAFEFVPGPGGSADWLDPQDPKFADGSLEYRSSFAVLPDFEGATAPYDPLEFPTSGLKVGDSVHLSGGGGLKRGTYLLLPAHYALLPGAFLVTPESGTTDLVPGRGLVRADGAPIVAGYRTVSGTGFRDARWSGFTVEPGRAARLRAEYEDHRANAFYVQRAQDEDQSLPFLPRDAGQMRFSASAALVLDGEFRAAAASGGRGGRLDIDAARLTILADRAQTPVDGTVNLIAESLNGLNVPSLALGGLRTAQDGEVTLRTTAATVDLQASAVLSGSEIIVTARDRIGLADGARIDAATPKREDAETRTIRLTGDSAFLRVSDGAQVELERSGVTGKTGSIRIDAGASVAATGSMRLDATLDTELRGSLEMTGGSLALGASRISLGEVSGTPGGLVLPTAVLEGLAVDRLILGSASDVSLYGAVDLKAQELVIQAAGLLGFDNGGATARLGGDRLRLENPAGAVSDRPATGTGGLEVAAKRLELGEGDYRLDGYATARFDIGGPITGVGTGRLDSAADLILKAAVVNGERGANTTITAPGHGVSLLPGTADAATPEPERLGARLSIAADRIEQAGTISLPSGVVRLTALKGDVALSEGAAIDVSGRELAFGDTGVATDGGRIELSATAGNVTLTAGARLNLGGQRGGQLDVSVPQGTFGFAGTAEARGAVQGGRFGLETGSLGNGGALGELGAQLAAAGFSDAVSLRTHDGDLRVGAGDRLEARSLALQADTGSVRIEGSLIAGGAEAGIRLQAGGDLVLAGTARLRAQGTPEKTGTAELDAAGGNGRITLEPGARIDLAGTGGAAGTLNLRARRDGADVAITGALQEAVAGVGDVTVEAVRVYSDDGGIGAGDLEQWKADTAAYMAGAAAIETRLGVPGALRPGLEIRSPGSLSLESSWNLLDWRYDGRPGVLTLRAGQDLSFKQGLGDGFKDYDPQGIDLSELLEPGQTLPVKDLLQAGRSWSYRLEAGGDVGLAANVAVRTGTGDIRIEAGRDFTLADATASVYTAGRVDPANRYGSLKNGFVAFEFYGEYPVDGGDLTLTAGRDIQGARSGQFFDDWLVRTGGWSRDGNHADDTPTAWALALGVPDRQFDGLPLATPQFRQNLGALGGGNVTVRSGRDVVDLSVMVPTTGRQTGRPTLSDSPSDNRFTTNEVEVRGGGDLTIDAGGDVLGGIFYAGRGTGDIRAAGAIGSGGGKAGLGPVLGVGDATFRLRAGGDLTLGAALNPTVVRSTGNRNFFFTYSDRSGLELTALAGDVHLQNDLNGLLDALNERRPAAGRLTFPGASFDALKVAPASLDITAPQGDIVFERSFVTYPAAQGRINLLAGRDITTGRVGENVNVTFSDTDPTLLPNVAFPTTSYEDATQRLQAFGDANLIHAQVPVHRGDPEPARIYAASGGIVSDDPLLFIVPKPVQVLAGEDLRDVSFKVQHPDYALSSFDVGRDLRYTSPRNEQGNLVNLTREIEVAGPGQVWVAAGRNIDLGAANGLFTIGNTVNSALAENGASLNVLVGLSESPRWRDFEAKYDPATERYSEVLLNAMRTRTGHPELTYEQALGEYQALRGARDLQPEPPLAVRDVLLAVLFQELRTAATVAAKTGDGSDYDPGSEAINALFPGSAPTSRDPEHQSPETPYAGDLKLFFSKIHTVDGGDINLLVPGGYVNAGLAVAFSGAKAASDLGIVAQRDGAVSAYLRGDFQVNQSRVFAMDGGAITLWSSDGNIDAGRGAKSAIAAPPPRVTFDEQGNLKIEFPPVVSGSGIRTAASTESRAPGDVFLAAPRGVVDAGEAGIGGNNITIAATAVIGASNIDVGGTSVGVPTANVSVPVASPGADAAAAGAAQTAQQNTGSRESTQDQATQAAEAVQKALEKSPLSVDFLGWGECSVGDLRDGGKAGCS
jgi:filamentous hemagglutinin